MKKVTYLSMPASDGKDQKSKNRAGGKGEIPVAEVLFPIGAYPIIRVVISGVFLWAGVIKLSAPREFAVIIEAFGLVPDDGILFLTLALPILEVIAALGLFLDVRGSLGLTSGLLVLFMVILGYGIYMGLDIDCGCFGIEDPEAAGYRSLRPALYRDILLMTPILYLYLWRYVHSTGPLKITTLITYLKRG